MRTRYGSEDFYRTLVAIDKKVAALVCRGNHDDGGEAYRDLADYIRVEREACAIRVARAKAEASRRGRSHEALAGSEDKLLESQPLPEAWIRVQRDQQREA